MSQIAGGKIDLCLPWCLRLKGASEEEEEEEFIRIQRIL